MLRGLSALLLVALLAAPAAGQQVLSDDEFALLGIPRPGAMLAGFGLPQVGGGFSKLLDELTQGDDEVTPNGAENVGGRVTIIGLPPMLSGLFRKSQEQARPTMSMRFRPMFAMPAGPSLSRPLKELSMLANGCEPCSRVQSHMRSMSVMLGPNGPRVETVTETGPDGEEHTTRTVTNEGAQPKGAESSSPDTGDDLLNAVLSPLMGGLPNFARIIQDAEQEQRSQSQPAESKPAAPQEAPLVNTPKEVTTDAAKEVVMAAINADRLDVSSPEKRQDLASKIAQQLGVSPDTIKVSTPQDDSKMDMEDEDEDEAQHDEDEDEDEAPPEGKKFSKCGGIVDLWTNCEEPVSEDTTKDADEDADELGKEFDDEEQERKDVVQRERRTMEKVSQAADSARVKANQEEEVADHLEAIQKHMQSLSPVN